MAARRLAAAVVMVFLVGAACWVNAQEVMGISPEWEQCGEPVPRHLFSIVNFPRLYSEGSDLAWSVFEELNPTGTQARIETWIHLMEPENDNNNPYVINWHGFNTDAMFRHVDDSTDLFLPTVADFGMRPVLLLCYNAEWLGRHGRHSDPPYDNEEWAEFAAAALLASERKAPGLVEYAEIWNEPSENGLYWAGTRDEFFDLFEAAFRRIKAELPHIKVGGPSVLGDQNPFFRAFIERFGHEIDFLTLHLYNDPAAMLVRKVAAWVEYGRQVTGRDDLRIMITEADNWNLQDDAKVEYLLERQFGLLEIADYVEGFHQFHLTKYGEGGVPDRFGFLTNDGAIMEKNYWAYWLFRDFDGFLVPVRGGDESIKAFASYNPEAGERTVLLYVPPGHNSQQVNVDFPLGPEAQLLTISTVDGLRSGITGVYLLEPGAGTTTVTVTVPTRGGVALTTGPLAPQPAVKIDVRWQKRTGRVGDETTAIVSVWNVSAEPLTGRLRLRGFPGEILSDVNLDLPTLEPGERCLETVELLLTKVTDAEGDAVWFEVQVPGRFGGAGRSLPQKVIVYR